MARGWIARSRFSMRGVVHTLHSERYAKFLGEVVAMRKRAGLTQRQLAAKLNQRQAYVGKSEVAERRLDILELMDWCHACGEDPAALVRKLETLP